MGPIQLTWWEYDELLEHLKDRPDIWTQSEDNPFLWLRSQTIRATTPEEEDETTNGLALVITPPADESSHFRLFTIEIHVFDWEQDYCHQYLIDLLHHWTLYSRRARIEKFLATDLGLTPDIARLGAIGITSFDQLSEPEDPDSSETPAPKKIWADMIPPDVDIPILDSFDIGTWFLRDGGYVNLKHKNGAIITRISIRHPRTNGFTHPLRGVVRPPYCTTDQYIRGVHAVELPEKVGSTLPPTIEEDPPATEETLS